MFKKKSVLLVILLLIFVGMTAFSEDEIITLYIDQIPVELESPALKIDGQIYIPMLSTFKTLGAQVYESHLITSYYLNNFVKIDIENNYYSINGKKFKFNQPLLYRENALYIPIEVLLKSFDLNVGVEVENNLFLNANSVIQYRNYDAIQYKQVSFDEDGVRFSIPLDWGLLEERTYGYDSSYGRIKVDFSTRMLNENIDLQLIMDTYEEHLLMEYTDQVFFTQSKQLIYNYLTSNVLYIDLDVNEILTKRVVHFVESDNQVYIIEFAYPTLISQSYILEVISNIMDSFYIDSVSFDANSEHYFESRETTELELSLTSELYSNMTVEDSFVLEGYFNTNVAINSLTVAVSRNNQSLEFLVPVQNNSFLTDIYTPFGLGKHNIKVSITGEEEKILFDSESLNPLNQQTNKDLLWFSVVNLSDETIRYNIPTKNVQSHDELILSMSNLLSYKYHTDYSKARALYDFIKFEIALLDSHDLVYTAKDVYEHYEGTKKEIAFYLTALLRAQEIPARIVEGKNDFSSHVWTEAYLNGSWLILDPLGDEVLPELLQDETQSALQPGFNNRRAYYNNRYHSQTTLEF